jgi:probable phosphoglycerate mutase
VGAVREIRQLRYARPPGATDILLIRHGESAPARSDAPFPLTGGHADPPLHPDGWKQADRLADRLQGESIDAIYVTTLRRTAETAAALAARLGLTPIVEADLREVNLGEWEGGSFRQYVADGHPLARKMLVEQRWDVIPGAEPAPVFAARVREALLRIAGRHPDQLVAVFTHGGVIGRALAEASGSRAFAFNGADNASISHLVLAEEGWVVRAFNDTAHLRTGFSSAAETLT